MPVASNLIRVTRPAAAEAGDITVFGYYYDPSELDSPNGKLYAYEYDVDGNHIATFEVNLPTTGVFAEYDFSIPIMRGLGDLVYDASGPGLTVVARSTRWGSWFWRPRAGTIPGRNIASAGSESAPVHVDGKFYMARNVAGTSVELRELDMSLADVSTVSSLAVGEVMENGQPLIASLTSLRVQAGTSTTWHRFPFSGAAPDSPLIATTGIGFGGPYSTTEAIVSAAPTGRFPRLVNTETGAASFLWPNEAPWLPLFGTEARVQYADPYILATEKAASNARRIIVGRADAGSGHSPILDFTIPMQGGLVPFLAGFGSIP